MPKWELYSWGLRILNKNRTDAEVLAKLQAAATVEGKGAT